MNHQGILKKYMYIRENDNDNGMFKYKIQLGQEFSLNDMVSLTRSAKCCTQTDRNQQLSKQLYLRISQTNGKLSTQSMSFHRLVPTTSSAQFSGPGPLLLGSPLFQLVYTNSVPSVHWKVL